MIRVRFAPSPTGFLHVGGARTALFNWLWVRKTGGTFVLRIEDTDRERSSEEHTRAILEGMEWLGLEVDEGPYFQSDGVEVHAADARRLLREGKAYRDFTDPEKLREEAAERGFEDSTRLAREKADAMEPGESDERAEAGEPFAVRFRVPDGETTWKDLVHGEMAFRNEDIEDLVILRSDGTPTYNMAVVSDDARQEITHVIRGDDHLSNTPKQILLYEALGREVPRFGHLPMILGADGKRLSKRHGATAVGAYADQGILPEAMVNFLALLGWNPGDEREVMGRDELVEAFTLDRVIKKSAVFDTDKLEWLNGQHMQRKEADELVPVVLRMLEAKGVAPERVHEVLGEARFHRLVEMLKPRARRVDDLAEQALPYLEDELEYDEDAVAKHWRKDPEAARTRLRAAREALAGAEWDDEAVEEALRGVAADLEVGFGKVVHPLRVAVLGVQHSPGIFDVLAVVGKERTLRRIDEALERV